jgi:NAD(P)-dependent dehydrogenase (short-subunit alcohol dehydrogenase family)
VSFDPSRRIVFTGAAGGIGTMTRPLLASLYPGLVLSDRVQPANLLASETFVAADLTKPAEVAALVKGRTASSISAGTRSRARGTRSSMPISSAATTCSRQRARRA